MTYFCCTCIPPGTIQYILFAEDSNSSVSSTSSILPAHALHAYLYRVSLPPVTTLVYLLSWWLHNISSFFFVPCSLYVPTQLFLIYSIPYKHASLQASFLHTPTSNFPSNSKSCCAGTPVSPLIPSRGHCPSAIVVKFFYLWNWTVLYYFIVLRVVPSISRCTQDTHSK
jgi:hypothetical protein